MQATKWMNEMKISVENYPLDVQKWVDHEIFLYLQIDQYNKCLHEIWIVSDWEEIDLFRAGKEGTMEWMYKQSKPENEDYLLGKRVDKHIEEAVETVKDGMLFKLMNIGYTVHVDLNYQTWIL